MAFVELQRCFVQIGKDQEPTLEVAKIWGLKIGGWIEWPELLEHRRVVLLAEASSGKSAEFRHQADTVCAAGSPAFFVTVEELADYGLKSHSNLQAYQFSSNGVEVPATAGSFLIRWIKHD
jgi:hypothetical protein